MKRRNVLIGVGVLAAAVAWYLFRPELLFIDKSVNEKFPSSARGEEPVVAARGEFHEVAHQGKGQATVFRQADGKHILRFTDFETSNGPALRVYLVAAGDARDSETVKHAEHIDLGALKGNKGDQNYDLPDGVDLEKYQAVTVWCQRFSVNFATAPLQRSGS
jgi:electron transfer DM13